ncbi:BRCT domain-containing protein [Aspergillus cavernicola]|uniref:BRCT domain-containing protein n=1 Tax=Aspergillus cavernicola TaxID=176166 RepID=A0ABR4J0F9_9EURO
MSKQPPQPLSNHLTLDPWNTTSTGHQRSESNPGTAWQRTREAKLAQQFRTGDCTLNSFVSNKTRSGSGNGTQNERVYEKGEWEWDWGGDARGGRGHDGRSNTSTSTRKGGKGGIRGELDSKQRDIRSMMRVKKASVGGPSLLQEKGGEKEKARDDNDGQSVSASRPELDLEPGPLIFEDKLQFQTQRLTPKPDPQSQPQPPPQTNSITAPESSILHGATIYINGQTTPQISDHKLKSLIVAHGATLALSLSRRVTHIIIGKPNSGPGCGGAGGGLAAGKLHREIQRGGWRGMKIVGVDWVLECIKMGKRVPETRFAINLSNQRSVLNFM